MRQTWYKFVGKESKVQELSHTQNPAGKLQRNKMKSDLQVVSNKHFNLFFMYSTALSSAADGVTENVITLLSNTDLSHGCRTGILTIHRKSMEWYDTWDGQKKQKEIEESLRNKGWNFNESFHQLWKTVAQTVYRFCRTIWAGSNSMTAHERNRESPTAHGSRRKSSRANENHRESPRALEYRPKLPRNT